MSLVSPDKHASHTRSAVAADAAVRKLQEQLQQARRREIAQRIGAGICLTATALGMWVLASAIADYNFELSKVWRASWLLAGVALAVAGACAAWNRLITRYTLSRAAAAAEDRLVQFGQRLRTTLDYQQHDPPPSAASPTLLAALHQDALHVSEQAEWDEAVDTRPLVAAVVLGCVLLGVWSVLLVASGDFRIATARALGLPAEYTTVTYSPQEATVKFGEAVTVSALVAGRPIEKAELLFRPAGSEDEWQVAGLLPPEANKEQADQPEQPAASDTPAPTPSLHGELLARLDKLERDLEFLVVAGPRDLPPGSIRVLQPLKLEKVQAHITPPEYTSRPEETLEAPSFKVLEGSTAKLQFQLSRAAANATLTRLENKKSASNAHELVSVPVKLDENRVLATLADLRSNASYTFSAEAADGMQLDPVKIDIRVQLDRKPHVQFVEPPEELVVTPTTEVPIVVDAGDDLGLHKVGVMYQIGDGPLKTLIEQSAEGSTEPLRLASLLMLEEHQLTFNDAVTYYAFAEDNYFGQPRRTTTPLRFIDIRPFKLEFQVVDAQGGACNGCSLTLEELIVRQRQNLTLSFEAQEDAQPPKALVERVFTNQSELLGATIEFEDGMKQRGANVPALAEAVTGMEKAIAALQQPDLKQAVTAEQESLAALIRARENLRKILKQSSSQSASACRKFDRQQRQKLRMPEKKQQDQQQQVAQARAKLDDLAKRERQWSEEARQSCQSSSSQSSSSKPSQSSASSQAQSQQAQSQQAQNQQTQNQQAQSQQNQNEQNAQQGQQSRAAEPGAKKSVPEVAAAQEQMQKELAELQQQLDKLNTNKTGKSENNQAAAAQARQAAESMQAGLDEVKRENGQAAAEAGQKSAAELEQLSAHLAAMHAQDFGQRLDEAQKLAAQLAAQQAALARQLGHDKQPVDDSKSGKQHTAGDKQQQAGGEQGKSGEQNSSNGQVQSSQSQTAEGQSSQSQSSQGQAGQLGGKPNTARLASDERALATQTEMLADLLERLKSSAVSEGAGVRDKLDQVHAENPPRQIASDMRQAADELQANRPSQAGQTAATARDRMEELTKSLTAARGEYAQPQLKELVELEEHLAQLQKQLQRQADENSQEANAAAEKWRELAARLERMAASDRRLADALQALRSGERKESGNPQAGNAQARPGDPLQAAPYVNGGQPLPDGFYPGVRLGDFSGLREVSKALQAKIQEAILAAALLDADQPVPPAYKELVEKYYRTLSDDLK